MLNKPQLLAIMFADLEAYSWHMTRNEVATIAFMERSFDRARRASMRFGGTLVKTTGDGWIALFPSAGQAVNCARLLHRQTCRLEVDPPSRFRISVHLGEVRLEGNDVYGHAVNIAARLQALADPGGIIVSQPVIAMLAPSSGYHLHAIGHPLLKNIGDDLGAYRLIEGAGKRQAKVDLSLEILGGIRLKTKTGATLPLRSRTAMALLGALALDPEDGLEARRIAVMLWPGKEPRKARQALTQTRRLTNACAEGTADLILADGPMLQLDMSAIEVDLHLLHKSLLAGIVAPALRRPDRLFEGLLSGLEAISPLFSTWLKVQREIWRDRLVAGLELCLERHADAQPALRAAAEALLAFEPGHEPACHALMRHFSATGRKEAALREFDRLSAHLRDVYQLAPGQEISSFAASLHGAASRGADGLLTGAAVRLPKIAVGSFSADDPQAQSVAEKFRADLLDNLSRFRTWAVLDLAGEESGGADYLLSARCDMAEGGASLSLRLVEPKARRIAWSALYSISAQEWRGVQGQIVGKIAAALEVYVSADRLAQRISTAPTDMADYDDWLRGESLLLRWTPEADREAKELFSRIISRTPDFAPAHASLASIHNVRHIVFPGCAPEAEAARVARNSAALAVELDPMDARNHLAMAWSAALTGGFDQAAVHLDLALSLNPFSPTTTISAAMGYAFLGDHLRAGQVLDRAIALAPMLRSYQWCYAATVRFMGGDDAAAIEAARRSGDQIVDNQGWLAAALARQGEIAAAQAAFAQLMAEIAPVWAGAGRPDAESVHAWFTTAYPIRREEDRAALSRALRLAMPAASAISGSG